MTKWDYLVVSVDGKYGAELQTVLKQAGQQGWELVSITLQKVAVFKRPILT